MLKCKSYKEFTWCEPPLEPGEDGTLHTEGRCKKLSQVREVFCDGNEEICDKVDDYG